MKPRNQVNNEFRSPKDYIYGTIFFCIILACLLAVILSYVSFPVNETQFQRDSKNFFTNKTDDLKGNQTITHLVDNFNSYYGKYSIPIDKEKNILEKKDNEYLILRKEYKSSLDLSRWDKNGILYGCRILMHLLNLIMK